MNIDFQTMLEGVLLVGVIKRVEKYGEGTSTLFIEDKDGALEEVRIHTQVLPNRQTGEVEGAQVVCGTQKKSIRDFTEGPDGIKLFEVLHFVSGVFAGQTFIYEYKNF